MKEMSFKRNYDHFLLVHMGRHEQRTAVVKIKFRLHSEFIQLISRKLKVMRNIIVI